jgi:hypothetical protein
MILRRLVEKAITLTLQGTNKPYRSEVCRLNGRPQQSGFHRLAEVFWAKCD